MPRAAPTSSTPRPAWQRYAVALGFTATAAVARWLLHPLLGGVQPFALFYLAVGLTACVAGRGPALVATAAGLLVGAYFFIDPEITQAWIAIVIYLLVTLSAIALVERARRSHAQALETASRIQQREADLQLEHAMLEAVAESVPDGILLVANDGRMLYRNRRFAEIWNMPADVLATGSDQAALDWAMTQVSEPEQFRAIVQRAYAGATEPVRDELQFKNGRIFDRFGGPVVSEGRHYGWLWTFRDVSAAKDTERALRESEERTRALSDATFDAVMLHEEGVILDVNHEFEALFGYRAEEVLGRAALPVLMTAESFAVAAEHIRTGSERPYEAVFRRKDGSTFFAEMRARNITYRGRTVRVVSAHDITERRLMEAALRESERRFHQAFADAPIGMVLTDLKGRLLHINRAYCQITGYTERELLEGEIDFLQLTHPDDVRQNRLVHQRLVAGEIPAFHIEKRYVRKDREVVWVRASASLRCDAQGQPTQIIGLVEDISDKKRAEAALREGEERFRAIADNIPQLAWMTSATGRVLWVNRRWLEYTGVTVEVLRREGWQVVHNPSHPASVSEGWRRALQTGEPCERRGNVSSQGSPVSKLWRMLLTTRSTWSGWWTFCQPQPCISSRVVPV